LLLSSHNQTAVAETLRRHCEKPSSVALADIGRNIVNSSPFFASLERMLTDYPHLASASLFVAQSIAKKSKQAELEQRGDISFLEFLDDSTILGSTQCALVNAVGAWLSLAFTLMFFTYNSWFFTTFLFPSEVPQSSVKNHNFGLWAFVFSTAYAFSASVCIRTDLDSCSQMKIIGNVTVFPSIILLFWGMLSSAAAHDRKQIAQTKQNKAEISLPPSSPFEHYLWRLNNFASQMEDQTVAENPLEKPKTKPKAQPLDTNITPEFNTFTMYKTAKVFLLRSKPATMGLLATIASTLVAAFGCSTNVRLWS